MANPTRIRLLSILVAGTLLGGCSAEPPPEEVKEELKIADQETNVHQYLERMYPFIATLELSEISFSEDQGSAAIKITYRSSGIIHVKLLKYPVWDTYKGPKKFSVRFLEAETPLYSEEPPNDFFVRNDLPMILTDVLNRVYSVQTPEHQQAYKELLNL